MTVQASESLVHPDQRWSGLNAHGQSVMRSSSFPGPYLSPHLTFRGHSSSPFVV